MFESVKLAIALLGGAICGAYDLKTSNMLDPVAWAMIATGIGLHTYESYITGNWFILQWTLFVTGMFFIFSLFMYYRGYWGGGDGEMLIAYGSLLPFGVNYSMSFPLLLFLNIFLVGGVYSLIYSFALVVKDKKSFRKLKKELSKYEKYFFGFAGAFIGAVVLSMLNILAAPLLFAIALFFLYPPIVKYSEFVEKHLFKKRIRTGELKEDDVLGEDIPELGMKAKLVRGLSKEEVRKIRKVRKYVVIKEGVRFIPVFPIALILSLFSFPFIF